MAMDNTTITFKVQAGEKLTLYDSTPRCEEGDELMMRMDVNSLFEIAMDKFCEMKYLDKSSLKFMLGKREIKNGDTPIKLRMKSQDIVVVRHRREAIVSNLVTDFKELLQTGWFSDISFQVESTTFRCHRSVLSARCPKFRAMFHAESVHNGLEQSEGMKESKNSLIQIAGCKAHIFRKMLEFVYADGDAFQASLEDMSLENKLDLLKLADEYLLQQLKQICEMKLLKAVDLENVVNLLYHSDMYHIENLKTECINFIVDNLNFLSAQDNFKTNLTSSTLLHEILQVATERFIEPSPRKAKKKKTF